MLGITFSAEAEPSAAERISDCFQYFESRMDVIRLPRYCKVLDSIKIILSTAPDEKERKHISLKWREAEIRVRLDRVQVRIADAVVIDVFLGGAQEVFAAVGGGLDLFHIA